MSKNPFLRILCLATLGVAPLASAAPVVLGVDNSLFVTSQTAVTPQLPPTQTFTLHSRPGANKIIYLDFVGHTVTRTPWNSGGTFTVAPYDTDGNPSTFSNSEHADIQDIWRRVAEDFAPFDVDVTTEAPTPDKIFASTSTTPSMAFVASSAAAPPC